MATNSTRNLAHDDAVAAGLLTRAETDLPIIYKRESDFGSRDAYADARHLVAGIRLDDNRVSIADHVPDPSYDQSNNTQLMTAIARSMEKEKNFSLLMKTEAVKDDSGKVDWTLVPFEALEDMVKVLEFGAKKYDSWNWTTNGGFKWVRIAASTLRHLFAWMRGEDNDPESGLSHISHAQCNLLFLAFYIRNKEKYHNDNRVKR